MNEKIIFIRTSRGEDEARSRTAHLSKDIKRALLMVDGTATVAEIMKRSSPSLRGMLADMFAELARGGFIQDKARVGLSSKLITPAPSRKSNDEADELDFTAAYRVPTQAALSEEAARQQADGPTGETVRQADAAGRPEQVQAVADVRAKLEAAVAKAQAETRAVTEERARMEIEIARAQAEAQARALAEERREADATRALAEQHAAAARLKAEQEAARVAAETQARAEARAVVEEKALLAAEVAKLKLQAEAEAEARAEERARLKSEMLRAQAERLEAAARVKAEQEAAEAAARLEAERHAKAAALAVRLAEQQAHEAKAEAERRARVVAEEKAALEAEVAKLKLQAEAEVQARIVAEQQARLKAKAAEAEQKAADEAVRLEAERHAREAVEAARRVEQHAAEVKAEAEAHARAVAEEKNKLEVEVARLKAQAEAQIRAEAEASAQREAEAARVKTEQEAERIRAEQEAERVRQEAERVREEAERIKQEAERVRAEQEAERIRVEQEAERVRQEAERVREEAERIKQEAERVRAEQEAERIRAEQEAERARVEQEAERARAEQVAVPDRRVSAAAVPGCDSRGGNNGVPVVERRATTAAVLFFDIADYDKQPDIRQFELKQQFVRLLDDSLAALGSGERMTLNTECGAAIGFLQHPTDALEAAMHFRAAQIAHKQYVGLRVRIGVHLGPVSLVKDMNGQINMLGDGVNSAQCVMGFAGLNQIYVSRAYFDFVSGLNHEYDELFRYRGIQQDKHGREHQIYELLDSENDVNEMPQTENHLADFSFEAFDTVAEQGIPPGREENIHFSSIADQLLMDSVGLGQMDATRTEPDSRETVAGQEKSGVADYAVEEQANIYSEADALQLANEQAAKWAEAAQRAEELARKKVESAKQHGFQQPAEAAPAMIIKPRRRPVSWGKLGAGLCVLLLLVLAIVPAVLPMHGYQANIEQRLGKILQQPVHIASLSGRILPTPRLVMGDVSIGEARQIQVHQVQAAFSFAALFGTVKSVSTLNLDGVEVKGSALSQVSDWLQQVAGDHQYPVARINLTHGNLAVNGIAFAEVGGELNFDSTGKFTQARMNAIGHKLALEIRAAPENRLQLLITLRDSAWPLLPNWVFDEFKATGELTRDELRIADFDGRIRGGMLTGNASINWRSGWRAQGTLEAHVIPLQNINKLLDGDLNGTASFQMQSASLDKLADAAVLNGVFSVKKGVIGGVDIVETTRLHSRDSLPGGRTHFDELSGELSYASDSYRFSPFRISDSVFKSVGTMTVARQQLSGHLSVDLLMRASSAALQIEGTTDSPSLHVAR